MAYKLKNSKLKEKKSKHNFHIYKVKNKAEARQMAIDFQMWSSENNLSWGEVARYNEVFTTLGKKYNLIKEFKENGII